MAEAIVFIDSEIGVSDKKIADLGAVKENNIQFHSPSIRDFSAFIADAAFLCGHNIIHHDLYYLRPLLAQPLSAKPIDTLYLSPLLFPERPYHALLKDDKLQTDELNNPLNDAEKARRLFYDEVNAFCEEEGYLLRLAELIGGVSGIFLLYGVPPALSRPRAGDQAGVFRADL